MPDSETFKLIMNGGLFGLFVLFFVWLLFKAEPNYRATVERITSDCRTAMELQAATNRTALETVCKTFEASLARQFQECREERRELVSDFQETIEKEFELNRDNRHEAANTMLKALREVWKRDDDERRERTEEADKDR